MAYSRRQLIKGMGALALTAGVGNFPRPAIAQKIDKLKIGIIAPRSGMAATVGEPGIRAVQWAVERINAKGGIAGRPVELFVEEETSPKETIERFRKLILKDKVDCVQGIISTGVSLAVAPVAEEERKLLMLWDGTTQDGVKEVMPNARYTFKSTDNECEAIMASLLSIKYFKGKLRRIAGVNPDYSYGRNSWETFVQILKKYRIEFEIVGEYWPRFGNADFTSHVAALRAAAPDLIFSSMLVADLPIFVKQAAAAELTKTAQLVLPSPAAQLTALKKEFTPEGALNGLNTMYAIAEDASPLQREFVKYYTEKYKELPHGVSDRAYFNLAAYKAAVEVAQKATSRWPTTIEVIAALEGIEVESLGGRAGYRKDHIANQMFYQGLSTSKNNYDHITLSVVEKMYSDRLQKPEGADYWRWIKEASFSI